MSNEITTPYDRVLIDPNEPLILPDGTAITGRLETFLYALCCLDYDNLPTPLSRIEEFANALITGEIPNIEPQSRSEQFFLAILDGNIDNLPEPQSRSEVLLNKLAVGDFDLTNVDPIQSRYELLLAYLIKNGGVGNLDYVLYEFYQATQTLYNTQEKPVKSAILKGNTKYRDIDTGDILDTFDETKNLELVSVKMTVLTVTGKNLFDGELEDGYISDTGNNVEWSGFKRSVNLIKINPKLKYTISKNSSHLGRTFSIFQYDCNKQFISTYYISSDASVQTFTFDERANYIRIACANNSQTPIEFIQVEEGSVATSYESFKSNILTVNEEVELRGIGDVKDELNLLTGELTQRVEEIVLDGSEDENWSGLTSNGGSLTYVRLPLPNLNATSSQTTTSAVSNRLPTVPYIELYQERTTQSAIATTFSSGLNESCLYVHIEGMTKVAEIRQWLSQNPITVQYELETESVKTVDLSVIDQDGNVLPKIKTFNDTTHVNVSSDGILPKVEMEVATYNEEDIANASVMTASMDEIYSVQNELDNTNSIQSEEIDSTMIASTEIYENIL